jgi:hypothetical protein
MQRESGYYSISRTVCVFVKMSTRFEFLSFWLVYLDVWQLDPVERLHLGFGSRNI